jgi:site-specific DNA recombinase
LLIAGEIEADDFQTIKTECEARISTLGIELQSAALLAERKESNFNKAVSYWIDPGKLFQELRLIEKEKFLEIMLSQVPVLHNQMFIQNIVHCAVQAIYKLDEGNNIQLAFATGKMKETDDNYKEELIAEIKQIAIAKHQDISTELGQMIVRFLVAFAKLTIENL